MLQQELIPHLFRTEYRKIVAVLFRHFGFDEMETAEDITSDTFLTAAQTWGLNGLPPNPQAWLYHVAKNKAKNYLQRLQLFQQKISPELTKNNSPINEIELDLSPQNISDSQLQMMFAICHPCISTEAQVGLSLRILCGFGIEEIATAFLSNKETINKRLYRAKEKLREENIGIALPPSDEIEARLANVLTTIYLLFNEGYYSSTKEKTVSKELCMEAIRLCTMLVENESTNKPTVNALLALMCFHTSRIEARMDKNGELILYDEQDTNLWNDEMIVQGVYYMNRSAQGENVSKYHLEAAIAFWHTQKNDSHQKWENVLQLYNRLLQIEYSPIAALNRTFALSKANGKKQAIEAAEKLNLTTNHFYYLLLGNLYTDIDNNKALLHLQQALSLAKTSADKQSIQKCIDRLSS